ncbi:MAG: SDR family oxidoreductase [Actinobacteria bacterium]|nr:SDR family oxidoreductase [Actinomycetota bacterium]
MRTVVVTGAARGIGAATARCLSEKGWAVVLVDVPDGDTGGYPTADSGDLEAVAASCVAPHLVVEADVRSPQALAEAVAAGVGRFGSLDAAVATAGVVVGGVPVWELSDRQWEVNIDTNLTGVFNLARAAIPHLLASHKPRSGRFVAVASAAGHRGLPLLGAYVAAKHGVLGLVRSLALDLRGTGVTANAIAPGSTDTVALSESARIYDMESPDEFGVRVPIERLIQPAEIASSVAWLLSEDAAAVTGACIDIDGGMTA